MDESTLELVADQPETEEASADNQEPVAEEEVQPENTEPTEQVEQTEAETGSIKNVRSAIKAASEAAPEQAATLKSLGSSYFREQAYKAQFPTVEEASNAKNLIQALGGVEGASQLQTRVQEYDAQESGLQNGDPAVLDSFFSDYPKQAVALAPAYLERVASQNPQELQKAVGPYAVQMIEQSGIGQYLDMAMRETDNGRKDEIIKYISDYLHGEENTAKQVLQNKPQVGNDRFEKERESIEKERNDNFYEGVRMHTDKLSLPVIDGEVDRYSKQYGLNEDQKKLLWSNLANKVKEQMDNDATYKKQVDIRTASKNRTPQELAKYISGEFNRRAKAEAFNVLKSLEPVFGKLNSGKKTSTGQVKAGSPKTSTNGGPLRVSSRPSDADIDWNKPDAEMNLIKGRAWLKSGRFVAWR